MEGKFLDRQTRPPPLSDGFIWGLLDGIVDLTFSLWLWLSS